MAWKGWREREREKYGAKTTRLDDEGVGNEGGIAGTDRGVGGVFEIGGLVIGGLGGNEEREKECGDVVVVVELESDPSLARQGRESAAESDEGAKQNHLGIRNKHGGREYGLVFHAVGAHHAALVVLLHFQLDVLRVWVGEGV